MPITIDSRCPRCLTGFLYEQVMYDIQDNAEQIFVLVCLNCGEVIDQVIENHRQAMADETLEIVRESLRRKLFKRAPLQM